MKGTARHDDDAAAAYLTVYQADTPRARHLVLILGPRASALIYLRGF